MHRDEIKINTVVCGTHKGRRFRATIVGIGERITLRYDNGVERTWTKSHVKKYYHTQPNPHP
jgi:hypothetical protein